MLGEVATVVRRTVEPSEIRDGVLYVGLENIAQGGRLNNVVGIKTLELASTKFVFSEREVLFGKLRPYLAKVARPHFGGVCSTDILPIAPGPELDRDYLAHFLSHPTTIALASLRATGANLPRLSPAQLEEFRLPLPNLPEQRRIARILDATDALRAARRKTLLKLGSLTEAILVDMFGSRATGFSWPLVPLRKNVTEFRYGTSRKSQDKGKPTLRIPNIIGGRIDIGDLKLVPVDASEFGKLRLVEGDLLFVRTNGNPNYVGRCAVFSESAVSGLGLATSEFIYASYLIRARIDHDRLDPVFIREFLLSADGRYGLRAHCKTSAGQYNINIAGLGAVAIPEVPMKLQREFSSKVNQVESSQAFHRTHLAHFDALFASLQDRAFKGEL